MTAQKNDCLLVLGGTGNVGQHVVSWLRKNAAPTARVLVGTRSPDGISPNREGGASVQGLTCDLGNIESIRHAILEAKPRAIFLCLPQALDHAAMIASSAAVAEASKEAGVSRLVRISSVGIDGGAQGPLGAAHVAAEAHCKAVGVLLSSVRPTSFHTNFVKYDMDSLRKENIFRSPLGCERQARVNWVHCRDIGEVSAILLARDETDSRGDEVVEVTGPPSSTLSATDMAALLTQELGREIRYQETKPPPIPAYEGLWAFLRAGGFDRDTNAVFQTTGRAPIDFREIVRDLKAELNS